MPRPWLVLIVLLGGLCSLGCDKTSVPSVPPPAPATPGKPGVPASPGAPASPTYSPTKPPTPVPPSTPLPSAPVNGPRWACDQTVLDFGAVWEGATVERKFEFRNPGTATLRIEKPKAHCSCSTTEGWTREVPPGGTGVIPFVLQTANKPHGPLKEYLTIETNDPATRSIQIWLTGDIKTVCSEEVIYDAVYEQKKAAGRKVEEVTKTKASFGKIKAGDRLHRVIRLRNTIEQPLVLQLLPSAPNPRFRVDFKEITPGQEFELTIIGEPPFPVGDSSMPIRFKTNIPERPLYDKLTAWATVPPRVEVTPQMIVYNLKEASSRTRPIKLINTGTTPVNVLAISTSELRYSIRLRPPDPATPEETVVDVVLPGEGYVVPEQGELIEIRTDDPEWPLIRVPVQPAMQSPLARPPDSPPTMYPVPLTP